MKIRGNTIGTPIKPKKVLVKAESLTEEEKAQARANIGALTGTATIKDGVFTVGLAAIENNILIIK